VPYEDILMGNVGFVAPADEFHGRREGESEGEFVKRLVREVEEEFLRIGPETIISFM
jgi:hypothetical protein